MDWSHFHRICEAKAESLGSLFFFIMESLFICLSKPWTPGRKWILSSSSWIRFNQTALRHEPSVSSQVSMSAVFFLVDAPPSPDCPFIIGLGWNTALQVWDVECWWTPERLDDAIKKWVGVGFSQDEPWPVRNGRWEEVGQINPPSTPSLVGLLWGTATNYSPFEEVPCAMWTWLLSDLLSLFLSHVQEWWGEGR